MNKPSKKKTAKTRFRIRGRNFIKEFTSMKEAKAWAKYQGMRGHVPVEEFEMFNSP